MLDNSGRIALFDGGENLVDLVLIHQLEISIVRRPGDWVCCVPTDNLSYSLHNPLFESDCHEAEDVLTICFVLRVAIWF